MRAENSTSKTISPGFVAFRYSTGCPAVAGLPLDEVVRRLQKPTHWFFKPNSVADSLLVVALALLSVEWEEASNGY